MVYGPNCPGNYARLEKLANITPIFPLIDNKRSMIHIDKLCQYVKHYIDNDSEGVYLPQDDRYINTSFMVKELANNNDKSIYLSKILGKIITLAGRNINIVNKIFGNLVYEKS